jgi:hypothetical protein
MWELLEKVDLPEGKEVSVTILETPAARDSEPTGMLEALRATAGRWKGLVDGETLKRNIMPTDSLRPAPHPSYEVPH